MKPARVVFGGFAIIILSGFWSPLLVARDNQTPAPPLKTASLDVAIDHFRNLEYDPAEQELRSWIRAHPADLEARNDLATSLLYHEMFRRGVLEKQIFGDLGGILRGPSIALSPGFQKELTETLDSAQALAEQRLERNPNDQDALYWAGVTHGTRAIYDFTMLKSYLAALREATEARRDHQQLLKINSNYTDALLVVGLNDYIAGSLPWYYRIVAAIAGFRGARTRGIQEVQTVAVRGRLARDDARFALAVLYRREGMYPQTIEVLKGLAASFPRNFLVMHELAGLYQLDGDWRASAGILDEMVRKSEAGEPGYASVPQDRLLYEAGEAHAQVGDSDQARRDFQKVARTSPNTAEGQAALRVLKGLP